MKQTLSQLCKSCNLGWNWYLDLDHAEHQRGQKYDDVHRDAHLLAILIWYGTLKKA